MLSNCSGAAEPAKGNGELLQDKKVLIVYLTRTKNTKAVAEIIHEKVGGDLVGLELVAPYPADYRTTVRQVASENASGFLPPLKTSIEGIEKYDIVFIGFPTWGMQLPPPMKSFLNQYDLSGKIVVPFNTNGGYGIGSSFETVKQLCPGSNLLEGFSVKGGEEIYGILFVIEGEKRMQVEVQVQNWLEKIGLSQTMTNSKSLSAQQKSIIVISAHASKGDLNKLKTALNEGLDAGLTINQIKEVLVHLYAYCGFPRSIRGLQTFMEVLDERKAGGISDVMGAVASPIKQEGNKYDRGKRVLEDLLKTPQSGTLTGYAAFAPVIDTFLKEHLFADIFERDVLTYSERELVTVSVLSTIGGVEPMLRSHLSICLNTGLTPVQLKQFAEIIQSSVGEKEAASARTVLNELLESRK